VVDPTVPHGPRGVILDAALDVVLRSAPDSLGELCIADTASQVEEDAQR
jgi:hypothetical protein